MKPRLFKLDVVADDVVKDGKSGIYNTKAKFRNQPSTPVTPTAVTIAKGAATAGFLTSSEMWAVAS